ncbi:hypothetical protein [Streptomyces sp. NPDC002619]|uniref:hypothetical protein n=1 Tax=Streptomyces sp. NPDC002619 TaxID=3364655 RepID=UPI00368FF9BD
MTVFGAFGTNADTARELSSLLADRLAVAFTERESHCLGIYFLTTLADTTLLQIQPNAVPGDHHADGLYQDESSPRPPPPIPSTTSSQRSNGSRAQQARIISKLEQAP